jgi:ketosteroid isomerase-like protein
MPPENTRLIERGYEAWNRRDVESIVALLDREIKWEGYTHIPESGTLSGRSEVKAWLEQFLEAWEQLDIEVTDLTQTGDQVVARVRFRGLGKGSGIKVEGGVDTHVWTVQNGKAVAVKLYQGTRGALDEDVHADS